MTPGILLATQYYKSLCKCEQCNMKKDKRDYTYNRIKNTTHILNIIYESYPLYKSKGQYNNIIYYYFKQLYNNLHNTIYNKIHNKIQTAVYLYKYNTIPALVSYTQKITRLSCPTCRRVLSMMSNPASSMAQAIRW